MYYLNQWRPKPRSLALMLLPFVEKPAPLAPREARRSVKQELRALADKLCERYPGISTDQDILSGAPHIKNVRLSVGNILAKLYLYGNIQDIVKIYEPHVTEDHVKQAIAYAQDFLETAYHAHEAPQVDG
jgi:uncharacterized protein (DUF433 family)